jgi:hypothetical protein
MLRISGYSAGYRFKILQGAVARHETMLKDEQSGTIDSFYRNRAQMVATTLQKGGKASAATWFLQGGVTSTLTTMATPGSYLKNKIQDMLKTTESPDGGTTKVLEASGAPITWGLRKSNPFKTEGCQFKDPDCGVDPKTDCGTMGSCYVLTCNECGEVVPDTTTTPPGATQTTLVAGSRRPQRRSNRPHKKRPHHEGRPHYIGTSAKSLHARMLGHRRDIRGKQMSNAMAKHNSRQHKDAIEPPKCTMKLLSVHLANLGRQVSEGLYLEKQNPGLSLNDRMEWSRSRGIIRIYSSTV